MATSRMSLPGAPRLDGYAVLLVCGEIDGYGHNAVFAEEIAAALADFGQESRIIDYRQTPRRVRDAMADAGCAFMVCFNGFGSELSLSNGAPGLLQSAFGYFRKPLFDLMHDCPSHEPMNHQVFVRDPIRHLLLTDFGYVQEAYDIGLTNVRYVPSITFPRTLAGQPSRHSDRSIRALLPVQLPPPRIVDSRMEGATGYRHRVFREIYETVSAACTADLRMDPRVETRKACREVGLDFDPTTGDARFLMTTILDRVKYVRRYDLVRALARLPVTLVTAGNDPANLPEGMSTAPARSFRDLLATMADSACVICPLPHVTGHHERALGAFTAGAGVLAAPNSVLDTEFHVGRELEMYSSSAEAAAKLADLLTDRERLQAMADAGRERALEFFAPQRLARTMLSIIAAGT